MLLPEAHDAMTKKGYSNESPVPASMEWYTPAWIFEALGIEFDLDPCHPMDILPWVPAWMFYNKEDDGLLQPWEGMVWMNPPYGDQTPIWVEKMIEEHEAGRVQGISLLFARTGTKWFRRIVATATAICFIDRRVQFVDRDGNPKIYTDKNGKKKKGNPGADSMLIAWGPDAAEALEKSGLGVMWRIKP